MARDGEASCAAKRPREGVNAFRYTCDAVGFGGDTDTIGAIAGALVGALHGASWIPARWYNNIENGQHGRDEIVSLARGLARASIT